MAQTLPTPLAGKSVSSSASSICTNTEPGAGPRPLTPRALRKWVAGQGIPAYRSEQILRWVYQHGAASFEAMTNLPPALRSSLGRDFSLTALPEPFVARSDDGTRKLLFSLGGGGAIESVLIPDAPRLTICVSSQAGCAMGCAFCATARLGLQRNLTAAEIVGQILAARRCLDESERITNIVFMGMGEPLANYDALLEAIDILRADWGQGFSPRRMTVSTVGLLPQLERLVREVPVNVAVSLSATTDERRDSLMPVNRRYPLVQLFDTCRALPIAQRRRITFEYVLLAGVNDHADDAARLIRHLHGIRAKVNLIPFNPFEGSGFVRPSDREIRVFQERLLAAGISATLRVSRGRDIQAACGQLAATRAATG